MLLEKARAPFDDPAWTFELKYDGYRLMAQTDGERAWLKSRNGADATAWFPEVVEGLLQLPPGVHVLDGEVCVLDQYGRTDFDRLHTRAMARRWKPGLAAVVYCIFDAPMHNGADLRNLPLVSRQQRLKRLFARPASSLLRVQGFVGEGVWLYEQAVHLELEGVVGKRLDSPYVSGERSKSWLKVKRPGATPAQRFVRPTRTW